MGLRLFFLLNFPVATFIQGATFIPDSRVVIFWLKMVKTTVSLKVSCIWDFLISSDNFHKCLCYDDIIQIHD